MAPVSVITLPDTVSEHKEHRYVLRRNELEEVARILNTATVVCASILFIQERNDHVGVKPRTFSPRVTFNLSKAELSSSTQRCLTRISYWGFCSLNRAFR